MTLALDIPGFGGLNIDHVLFDLNGTLALNGVIADSTRARLHTLGQVLKLHVISADTHGTLAQQVKGLPLHAHRIAGELGAPEKLALLRSLGAQQTIAVGNGRNDVAMLESAALGIAIAGPEGAARDTLLAADIIFTAIDDALDAIIHARRLLATLRG